MFMYNGICILMDCKPFLMNLFYFLQHEQQKIYMLHDTPHIIKNVRNTLKNVNAITYQEGKVSILVI
jgi:hypothetical protein